MIHLKFINNNEGSIYIQIDPWASLYLLNQNDELEIAAECQTDSIHIDIDENLDTRIVLLPSSEYFVIHDGKLLHWTEYPSNIRQ